MVLSMAWQKDSYGQICLKIIAGFKCPQSQCEVCDGLFTHVFLFIKSSFSLHLSILLFIHLCIHLSIYLSIYPSIHLSILLFMFTPSSLLIHPCSHPCVYPSVHSFVHLFFHLSTNCRFSFGPSLIMTRYKTTSSLVPRLASHSPAGMCSRCMHG